MRVPAASRRAVLAAALVLSGPCNRAAVAFENRLPPDELEARAPTHTSLVKMRSPLTCALTCAPGAQLKYKTPRTPGPKPTDLGTKGGTNALRPCTDGKPHCFSSTPEQFADDDLYSMTESMPAGWLVAPFKYEAPLERAVADVRSAIAAYPPGQRGIDGGGFKLMDERSDGTVAYLYVQFESKRKGYIDDMEFALADGVCNVRTSSRLGYLDYGVNAKRWNWFAQRLGETKGWKTAPLLSKGHEEYFALNGVGDKDMR